MILAYIIANSKKEADIISEDLLDKRLVYSVNILPEVQSMRREGDQIIRLRRTIILAKTKSLLYKDLEEEVKRVQISGSAIVFSMPLTQMSQDLFDNIQKYTLKV